MDILGQDDVDLAGVAFTYGPTVATDKGDYYPGETVIITESHFLPDESVQLLLHEEPNIHPDLTFLTTADATGNIINSDYVLEEHDRGAAITLTATGQTSGLSTQTAFTDNVIFVQNLGTVSASGALPNPLVLTVTGSVTAGHSIIIGASGTSASGVVSCTDSKLNTYTVDANQLNGAGGSASICAAHNVVAPCWRCRHHHRNLGGGGSGHAFSANEFSGLSSTGAFDKTKGGNTNNTSPTSTSTSTTSQADELLFGAIWYSRN